MPRVVVTGGAGFIGLRLIASLHERGIDAPEVVDRALGGVGLEDMKDNPFRAGDVVVHLAARADISANWSHPAERVLLYRDNVDALIATLEFAIDAGVAGFVFASTCAVYGDTPPGVIRTEADRTHCTSPYAASKLAGEAFVEAYAHKGGFDWHVARLVSCVGRGYTHGHIADFARMAKNSGIAARDNCRGRKSFLHVDDAADALTVLAFDGVPSGVYNVTGRERWSPLDTLRAMGRNAMIEDADRGWIGDPVGLTVSGERLAPWWRARSRTGRSVADGVFAALKSLGYEWPSPR